MARQIFIVEAFIVDATGAFNYLQDYPKKFDSQNYQDDVDKTQKRAEGDASEAWGGMCKRDDRMIQTVELKTVDGFQLWKKSMGGFPADPGPNSGE